MSDQSTIRELIEHASKPDKWPSTHYEGCEFDHPRCMARTLARHLAARMGTPANNGPRGTCGHTLAEHDNDGRGYQLAIAAFDCDAVEGFCGVVRHGTYCRDCAKKYREDGAILDTEEEETNWMMNFGRTETP